jgi:16S rRNA (guanine(527)-N(7))-methyltransferase RsmG
VKINKELLKKGAASFGVALSDFQLEQFSLYNDYLMSWNAKINLTAITNPDEVVSKHFVDSIAACAILDMSHSPSLVDIGSGAGFPGFALKIAFPGIKLTAIESICKKVRFLEKMTVELNMENVRILGIRAEDVPKQLPELVSTYDIATARGVADVKLLLRYSKPLLAKCSSLLLWKGRDEIATLPKQMTLIESEGFCLHSTKPYMIPLWEVERFLIRFEKK